jgi:hypothetical protein
VVGGITATLQIVCTNKQLHFYQWKVKKKFLTNNNFLSLIIIKKKSIQIVCANCIHSVQGKAVKKITKLQTKSDLTM